MITSDRCEKERPLQVYEPTPDNLALWTKPNWLVMLLGALMVVLGCVTAVVPGKATTLTLTRAPSGLGAGEVHITTMFRDYRIVRIPLRMLHGAVVNAGSLIGPRAFYHLDLDVRDDMGGLYLSWYANHDRVARDAASINAFVADPKARQLVIINDKRPLYFPLGGFIAFIGLTLLFWGSLGVRATFDRMASQVVVRRRSLLGTNVDVIPFTDIKEFHVAGIAGDCQLYMELASGRKVNLSSSTDHQNMVGPRRIRAIRLEEAARIRDFCTDAGKAS